MTDTSKLAAAALTRLGVTLSGDIAVRSPIDGAEIGKVSWGSAADVAAAVGRAAKAFET